MTPREVPSSRSPSPKGADEVGLAGSGWTRHDADATGRGFGVEVLDDVVVGGQDLLAVVRALDGASREA